MEIKLTAEWILKKCINYEFCEDEDYIFFDYNVSGIAYDLAILALDTLKIDHSKTYCFEYKNPDGTIESWDRAFILMEELKEKCPEIYENALRIRKCRIEQNSIESNPPELYKPYPLLNK